MRLGLTATLTAVALFASTGCSQPSPTPESTTQQAVPTAAATTAVPAPASTLTSQSIPPAQINPTTASLPQATVTPQPTATTVPPPTPLPLPTATLAPPAAPLPLPTPAPMPTATPVHVQVPTLVPTPTPTRVPLEADPGPTPTEPGGTLEPQEFSLAIEPAEPYSGRDAFFTLQGLDPWERVTVQFFDPAGKPAEWVTEYESYLTDANGNPVTERRLYADAQGRASWRRIGTRDQAGEWTVRLTQEDTTTTLTYPMNQLTLTPIGSKTLGLEFRLYQGPLSNTYYTGNVPGALTVDLQDHLKLVTDSLRGLSGLQSDQTPTIYLVADLELLKQVSESTGSTLGFADGYYRSAGEDSGVYMHTDSLLTGIQRLLTHEYIHLALSETVGPVDLPSWLNEGTATYYEYLINVSGDRAIATKHPLYRSATLAKNAAQSGDLLVLTNLEDQDAWNSQTEDDRIDLQYAQSHMAVRYLAETYGKSTPIDMMTRMGQGATLSEVFSEIVGVEYPAFERQFALWLKSWEDPERTRIAEYTRSLNDIMSGKASIGDLRSVDLASDAPPSERVATKRVLVADAEDLLARIGNLSPPPELRPLHDDAARFMERFVRLLTLELEHLLDQEYLVFLGDIISSVDSISRLRSEDIQGGAPPGQRVTAKPGLVADAETLVRQLLDAPPPPSLNALQLQELAFLDRYIQFLNLELEQQREEVYLRLLTGIITEVDGISSRRSKSIQSTGSSSQRISAAEGLVSDSESLLSQMDTFTPPSRLQALQLQGTTYLKKYVQWLTIELEFAQTNDSAKLDQGNAMIAEINTRGNEFRSGVSTEQRAQPNQNEANNMLDEIADMESLLVQGINAGFRNSATLQQANAMLGEVNARENTVRNRIGDLEFIYNLREP